MRVSIDRRRSQRNASSSVTALSAMETSLGALDQLALLERLAEYLSVAEAGDGQRDGRRDLLGADRSNEERGRSGHARRLSPVPERPIPCLDPERSRSWRTTT
jgi:hypothetical protein